MQTHEGTTGRARRWQDVAKDRRITLRELGMLLGRPHQTMLSYSSGKRRVPHALLERMGQIFGERVQ